MRRNTDQLIDWDDLLSRCSDNSTALRHTKFDIDGQLAAEEATIVNADMCGVAPWLEGRVRCRLLRSGTDKVLYDTAEFMQPHVAHSLLCRASRAQRQVDEVKGYGHDV